MKLRKNTAKLQLFPATAPPESVCIDIPGEPIKAQRRNEYFLLITDRFSKMTTTVQMKEPFAVEVANHFKIAWVFNYVPQEELLADNGVCFTSMFFSEVCEIMSIKNNSTKTYDHKSTANSSATTS